MSEANLILIFVLATMTITMLAWLALFSVVSAKTRIIGEQRKALEAEQRLRQAQETFTANTHHELKTPLQIISGHLHILGQLDPRPDQLEALGRAETATRRLQGLVQDLLDFTALQQGTLVLRPEWTDLDPHLRALASDYRTRAEGKGLAFHLDATPIPTPLRCDEPRLRRALAALLDNALRFTTAGTLQVRWWARTVEGRCLLRFEVADTGQGLPEDWPRLLAPFEQGASTAHQVHSGLGLGLPLASGFIQAMEGRMGLTPLPTGTLAWAEVAFDTPDAA